MKVYCNDVYLGKTGLEISKAEFHDKVKPWDTPPGQKMILGPGDEFTVENKIQLHQPPAGTELRWFYIPYNYFDRHNASGWKEFSSHNRAVKSGYWWRFENDGCSGLAATSEMVSGSYDSLHLRIWAHPALHYPAAQPYLDHLLHNLKRSNYQPSMDWRTLVGNFSGPLFRHLYEIGQRDSRVMRALELAIQTEFSIHKGMSAEEWEAVLEKIVSRVKQRQTFNIPSPEFTVMDLMIQHNMKLIETKVLELLTQPMDSRSVLNLRDGRSVSTYGGSETLVFNLLEYAVLKNCPPTLFKRLVYESRRGERFLSMVGNYSRTEALQIVRQYLDDIAHPNPVVNFISPMSGHPRRWRALEVVTYLRNPALEPELRRFVLKHGQDDSQRYHHLRKFIYARLERSLTEAEADSLVEWIVETVPLSEREKLQFLIRIDSGRTYHYAREILRRHPHHQRIVVGGLTRHPNRLLDGFLIEVYKAESAGVRFGGIVPIGAPRKIMNVSPNLIRAMVLCDTPRMRAFLERIWNASNRNKVDLLKAIKQEAPKHFSHLHDWTTLISEIEDADTRLAAIPVLDQIDTPESSEVLADWARSSAAAVRDEAEWALAKYHERSRKAEALLAGNIKPDDLLVDQQAYVWDGETYVPEETALGDK